MLRQFALEILMQFIFNQFMAKQISFTTKIDQLRNVNPV